jgi:5-methylcytosine-specific restriction endonuclease McrA
MFRLPGVICVALILTLIVPTAAFPHGGGLDANGGHYNRKTGEYHYHQKRTSSPPARETTTYRPSESSSSAPIQSPRPSSLTSQIREQRINEYFRNANENVGALSCNQVMHDRGVPQSVKDYVKRRDGDRCVICGSTRQLEVDHKRALMNGGDNSDANLATLCDDCHTDKTRMDTSLRRKREKLCRQ